MSRKIDVAAIFASDVFDGATMRERLPKKIYAEFRNTILEGKELDPHNAEIIAHEMKEWAIEKGATHFTHWFQPLTGVTAEKHDAFIDPRPDGSLLLSFSGKELIKGEPDGSSFPSGGMRATCEARGYTAWDCTSPAFIRNTPDGSAILCIPTIFCSYTGEALDKKTPLIRSTEALRKQALRIVRLFGDTEAKEVNTYVGGEQEYFLIDKPTHDKREDLIFTGRTLFGAPAPKGQEMSDHYFRGIKDRVLSFMTELNEELWKLGVNAKTQHNEVAPGQKELAPVYTDVNKATDHNQLMMETMKRVALRHDLVCLLHEKPFEGINGSGKHNNWSLSTDTGRNLLDPGENPHSNRLFLLVLVSVIKAVDEYAALLRYSAASAANDHRLGANEAPPAIVSIFLGDQLNDVLEQLTSTGKATSSLSKTKLDTGVSTVPSFMKDTTDRNRTSPFAFTGNKFEFRMVGSSASLADPNTVLNTIVAEEFMQAADILEKTSDFDAAAEELIAKWAAEHSRVIFNGDGYTDEWIEEAERRGLPNITNTVDAIGVITEKSAVELFGRHGVMNEAELKAREEVGYETYSKAINIESRTMTDMIRKQIIPAVIRYKKELAETVNSSAQAGSGAAVEKELLTEINSELEALYTGCGALEKATDDAVKISDPHEQAAAYRDNVNALFPEVRSHADALETLVAKDVWPFPVYSDILFNV
ncbi:MAG: glutamine synthetase III [Lachnospiraceae bacterium]|nr:glutamine synthetase III [Lachnospiraceae bacterium]